MVKCKICGKKSSPIIGDICVDCLADVWGDIVEMTPMTPIKFIDLRDSDVEYNFAFFDIIKHSFVTMNGKSAWYSFDDLADDIMSVAYAYYNPGDRIRQYYRSCPDWVRLTMLGTMNRERGI
jgi:hypothetical protein